MKPYFVPLMKEYFLKFKNGEQDCEIRPNNHRGWNSKNIYPGRSLLLSKGYGNYDRLMKEVRHVKKALDLKALGIPQWHIDAVEDIYGKQHCWMVAYV